MRPTAKEQIQASSYGRAVEQALFFAEQGMTPEQAIAAVNLKWSKPKTTWDDAIYALAYAWRRHGSGLPRTAFEAVPVERPVERPVQRSAIKPETGQEPRPVATKRLRRCLKCGTDFMSAGPQNRICSSCAKRNEQVAGGFAA